MARILVVCNSAFFLTKMRAPLVRALAARGHQVECACDAEDPGRLGASLGVPIRACSFPVSASPIAFARSIAALRRIIRAGKFDLVVSSNRNASIVARIAAWLERVPVNLYTAHGFYFHDDQGGIGHEIAYRCEAALARITSFTVSVSQEDLHWMVARGAVAPDRIAWIGQGIDTRRFRHAHPREDAERRVGLAHRPFRIGAVGRIVKAKGFLDLLHAFAEVRNSGRQAELLLIGGNIAQDISPFAREFSDEVRTLGVEDSVVVTGIVDNVEEYLSACDVFVLPSYREGVSRALLEAMSMELAIVATSIRGCREVIEESKNGLLYPPHDVQRLAALLQSLHDDPARRARIGQNARMSVVERFDERDFVKRQVDIFERLLAERATTPEQQHAATGS